MEDAQIIDHFFRRDPEAIRAAQEKYEKRCLAAARAHPAGRPRRGGVRQRRVAPFVECYPTGAPPFAGGVHYHRHPPPGPGQVRL